MNSSAVKDGYSIECSGKLSAKENAKINAESSSQNAEVVCYSTFLDYNADIKSKVEAVDGVIDMK